MRLDVLASVFLNSFPHPWHLVPVLLNLSTTPSAQGRLAPALECRLLAYAYGEPKTQSSPPQWNLDPANLAKMSTEDLKRGLHHAREVQRILAGLPPRLISTTRY